MNEKHIKTFSVSIIFLLIPVLLFSVMGYFRAGDLRDLESSVRGIGQGIGNVNERTASIEESLTGFTDLINGVETISNGITESVQQNERGLKRIRESVSVIEDVIRRIQDEGITED